MAYLVWSYFFISEDLGPIPDDVNNLSYICIDDRGKVIEAEVEQGTGAPGCFTYVCDNGYYPVYNSRYYYDNFYDTTGATNTKLKKFACQIEETVCENQEKICDLEDMLSDFMECI